MKLIIQFVEQIKKRKNKKSVLCIKYIILSMYFEERLYL